MEVSLRNLGTVNKNKVIISTEKEHVTLYFSYETIVGVNGMVCENNWGPTTGKLLNELEPDKSRRIPHEEVKAEVQRCLKKLIGGV